MTTDGSEPYVDAPAASFIEGGGPTYALVGVLIESLDESGGTAHHILVGEDAVHPVDELLVPLFEWFTTPRNESQVTEWLKWAEAPSGLIEAILGNGLLVRIDTTNAQVAAKSLRGVRVVPMSLPDLETSALDGMIAVKRTVESRGDMYTTVELADVLWGDNPRADIESAINLTARVRSMDRATTARRVLTQIPFLLEYGFVRLERVNVRTA